MAALNPLVVELYPHTPSAHLTAVQVSYCVGLIMIGLSGFLIAGSGGWRLPFIVCAPLLTIGSVPFFLGRYPPPAYGGRQVDGIRRAIRSFVFWAGLLAVLLISVVEFGVSTWIVSFIQDAYVGTNVPPGAGFVAYAAALMVGRLAAVRILRWVRPALLVSICAMCGAGTLSALFFVENALHAVLLFGLTGVFQSCLGPTITGYVPWRLRTSSATVIALLGAISMGGSAIGPYLVGIMADVLGSLRPAITSLGVLHVVTAIIFLVCMSAEKEAIPSHERS